MKKQLFSHKRLLPLFYSLCLMFCVNLGWGQQQTIGSFPYMEGGFENYAASTLSNVLSPTVWSVSSNSNSTVKAILSNVAVARTGSKYVSHTTIATGQRLQSPTTAIAANAPVPSTNYTVQYYYNTTTEQTASLQGIIYNDASNNKNGLLTSTYSSGTWVKGTYTATINAAAVVASTNFAGVRHVAATTSNVLIDDFVVYAGAVDNTDPVGPTSPIVSGLNVSFTASTNVDGGGYIVVRYASLPNADNDPNVNGIYGVGNTITNGTAALSGTVVYVGTDTSFTDGVAGSTSGSDYYKIYTVDKAFNYSKTDEITGTAVVAGSPLITSTPVVPLTGFTYSQGSGPSAVKQTVISGSNLASNIIVSLPTYYELSADNFATAAATGTIDLGLAGGTLSIRLKASLANGVYNENIVLTSDTTIINVPVNGSVSGSYLYNGTGSLTDAASWIPTPNITGANGTFNIQSSVTTDAAWVLGAGSKIILGDPLVPAVTLTVASGFGITGTIDIPAASSGSNSLVLQDAVTPTFGTLHVSSEVYYNAAITTPIFTTSTIFGKVIINAPAGQVSWVGNPIIQANGSLTVVSGSTLFISGSSNYWTTFHPGASVVINGTVRIQKAAGFVNSNITLGTSYGSLQFTGAENLTLGANSIIEYNKATNVSTFNITARSYVNLTISGLDNNKAFLGATTVTGKLVINTTGNSVLTALTSSTPLTISSTGTLILTSGTLNTGGFLTLKSSECCTATVAPVGGTILGNVTVERYIPAGQRAYRLLSSPVTTTTFIDTNWQAGIHITGTDGATNGFDATTSNGSSMFTHNNTTPAWTAVANTNATVLTAGVPYLTYIRGSKAASLTVAASNPPVSIASNPVTLSASGALKIGDVLVNGLNETAGGFSAVGNPYQAQVDMKKVLVTNATSNNLAPYYYVVDPKLGTKGAYATVDVVTPSNGTALDANQYLQPGQACFVQTIATGVASLNFTEADKFEGTQTSVFRTKNVATASINLTLSDVNANRLDVLKVAFDANESNELNQNDASKLINFDESLATSNSGKLLAIEKRAIPTDTDEIPLNITKYRGTSYSIKAQGTGLTGSTPYLFDKYTSSTTEIPQDGTVNYAYTVDAAIPASIAADRFKLIYAKTLKTIDNELAGFALYPNPSKSNSFSVVVPQSSSAVSLRVSNLLGQQLYLQNDVQSGATVKVTVNDLKTSGVYLVSLSSEGKTTTTKWIVE